MIIALTGKVKADSSADEYFLSSRNLPWYSIALSTIATNIQGYQFLGMMGSAYLFGLAQANLEINAVQGILINYKGPADYKKHFQATYDYWKPIAKQVGVYKRKD